MHVPCFIVIMHTLSIAVHVLCLMYMSASALMLIAPPARIHNATHSSLIITQRHAHGDSHYVTASPYPQRMTSLIGSGTTIL